MLGPLGLELELGAAMWCWALNTDSLEEQPVLSSTQNPKFLYVLNLFLDVFSLFFMCPSVLPACLCMLHVHPSCPQRSEEDIGPS